MPVDSLSASPRGRFPCQGKCPRKRTKGSRLWSRSCRRKATDEVERPTDYRNSAYPAESTSSTASGPPSPQGEGFEMPAYSLLDSSRVEGEGLIGPCKLQKGVPPAERDCHADASSRRVLFCNRPFLRETHIWFICQFYPFLFVEKGKTQHAPFLFRAALL